MNDWVDAEGHVERAHQLFEAGRWADAEHALREAIAINPDRAEWHFNLGLTLEAAGRYDEAAKSLIDCHELQHDDPQVLILAAVNMLRSNQVRDAITWLEKVEKLDPQNAASFVNRVDAYQRLGDHEQAEVMFYMAQQCDPKNPDAYVFLADSLLARGMHEKAVWCLREAATLDPQLPGVHARLAHAYSATGRLERARQLYLRELRNDPGDIATLLDLGCLLVQMNRLPEAGEKFRRVLEMETDHPDAHFYLADLAERQGQHDLAREQFGVVLRLDQRHAPARRRLAASLLFRKAEGDAESARELLMQELEDFAQRTELFGPDELMELGRTLLSAGMNAEAKRVLHRLVVLAPGDAPSLHLYSVAQYELGERDEGIETCRRVLKLDPKFVPALHNIAVACMFQGQWSKARYWVHQALLVDPDDAPLRHLRLKLRLHTLAEAGEWLLAPLRIMRTVRRRRGGPRSIER
jgi:tetratricopeptide (TPR) repeat protein